MTEDITALNQITNHSRLLIISNRLPFVIEKQEDKLEIKSGSGGLSTALAPVLRNRGGIWIGSLGAFDVEEKELEKILENTKKAEGFLFFTVPLTKKEVSLYYDGFSNEIIWPLFHDLQMLCHFVPEYWESYQSVNKKFAEAIVSQTQENDFIWVHDYHLMLVGQELRAKGLQQKLGFFLHIPFPPLDIFLKLPWRKQVIQALLEYDLIGFQTTRDRRNFIQCVRALIKNASITYSKPVHLCTMQTREVRIGAFPISIDFEEFNRVAASKEVEEDIELFKEDEKPQFQVFSVDRLDYTKGIVYRLEGIRTFLKQHPEFHKKVQFLQLVVPSRSEIPQYHNLKEEINRRVGEINSQFTQDGWVPIHHLYRSYNRRELIAHYRSSNLILITPIKDGMNLVVKEYIASNVNNNGVVILSEFAGAATQLYKEVILVNPYDITGVANAIHSAMMMPLKERRRKMKKMRYLVEKYDVFWWVKNFLNTAFSKNLEDFPQSNENGSSDFISIS